QKKPLLSHCRDDRRDRLDSKGTGSGELHHLDNGNQDIAANDYCFVSSIESQQCLFLIVTGWLQYRVSELSDEECAHTKKHCEVEVGEDEDITKYKRARTQQVKELID